MGNIYFNEGEKEIILKDFDGEYFNREFLHKKGRFEIHPECKFNFYREGDNFAYVLGEASYSLDCNNNLIISDYYKNKLIDVKNSLINIHKGVVKVQPIFNLEKILEENSLFVFGREISYNIPKSVSVRENLVEKDPKRLEKEIERKYSLSISGIFPLSGGRTKWGIYYIKLSSGKECVLKYQGQEKQKANVIAKISNINSDIFSKVLPTVDGCDYTFELEDGFYGIEEFILGDNFNEYSKDYFKKLGALANKVQNRLERFIINNLSYREYFIPNSKFLSESHILSLWIDLNYEKRDNSYAKKSLKNIVKEKLINNIHNLPKKMIHGDLNHSNLIWQGTCLKIIDKETIMDSRRVMEPTIPLLFNGNKKFPEYLPGSLNQFIGGFNSQSEEKFLKREFALVIPLLEYSLIKNYVVRNIRRGLNQHDRWKSLFENLTKLNYEKEKT